MCTRDLAVGSRKVICKVVKGRSGVMEANRKKKVDSEKKKEGETNGRVDVFIRKEGKRETRRRDKKTAIWFRQQCIKTMVKMIWEVCRYDMYEACDDDAVVPGAQISKWNRGQTTIEVQMSTQVHTHTFLLTNTEQGHVCPDYAKKGNSLSLCLPYVCLALQLSLLSCPYQGLALFLSVHPVYPLVQMNVSI